MNVQVFIKRAVQSLPPLLNAYILRQSMPIELPSECYTILNYIRGTCISHRSH